ncbi:MAG: N-acyl-D-amino-acid deacylase [Eubacterium sp.]|nr:N-acyl-D-amino-acid deacylase [Eubacterium sp.]
MSDQNQRMLLKNGFIVDGTGSEGRTGNLLIEGGLIRELSEKDIYADCETVDCSGKVISPGFIDFHSHNDWFLPSENADSFTAPFTKQGITTFFGGNCGFSAAGFRKNSRFVDKILENPFRSSGISIQWSSMKEYFDKLSEPGISNNFANLAGHGCVRTSIKGYDPAPLSKDEMNELLMLLEEAMDQGAKGVSLGLQYEPGIFSTMDEIREVAKLVKRKDKLLTVHSRASSAVSGAYPIKPFFGQPHNILALEEMINIAKETGVRLQYSHLLFVGEKTWKTFDKTMAVIDKAISDGVDIKFDTYAYSCGASVISVILPGWFMAKVPQAYENKNDILRLKFELTVIENLLGFGFGDIQISYIDHPELTKYIGRFISDIAKEWDRTPFETYLEFAKKSNGKARVMQYKYSNSKMIEEFMKHPACLFMTDAWVETNGAQNQACFGCFPKFLQMVREKKIITLEEAIYKMTFAAAKRADIKDRGVLKTGMAADITVFDRDNIRDNTSQTETDKAPSGINHVFVNGVHVLKNGELLEGLHPGVILR